MLFFFNDTATTEIYTLSLHDALPISFEVVRDARAKSGRSHVCPCCPGQRGQTRSEEHTSELQSRLHLVCRLLLEKKKKQLQEYVFPMIRKMTPIPAVIKNSFGTADANMQRAVVKVVEGESTVPGECTPLGVCDIQLPPYLPKGSPVKLTYQYNANQVVEVDVQAAGNTAKVTIDRNTGLAPQEISQAASGLGELHVS